VLARDLDDLEPHLTHHGYNAKSLADLLNVRRADLRAFLAGRLPLSRTQEVQPELLAAGLPLSEHGDSTACAQGIDTAGRPNMVPIRCTG
jgi:hypothetical protein